MLFSLGNDGKYVNEDYHRFRQRAKRVSWSIQEWGPHDIEDYDLENVPLGDGTHNRYYLVTPTIQGEVTDTYSLKELKTHY